MLLTHPFRVCKMRDEHSEGQSRMRDRRARLLTTPLQFLIHVCRKEDNVEYSILIGLGGHIHVSKQI